MPHPCKYTTCPEGFQCTVLQNGITDCVPQEGQVPWTHHILATGNGGCACQTTPGASSGLELLLPMLGVLITLRQRRRRLRQGK
jgi:MYXO-CTERM domain-containing protein